MENQEVMDQFLVNRQNYMIENISADAGCGGIGANEVVGNSGDIIGAKYDEQLHEGHGTGDDDESKYIREVQQSEKSQPQESFIDEHNLSKLPEEEIDTAKRQTGNTAVNRISETEFEDFDIEANESRESNNQVIAQENNDTQKLITLKNKQDEIDDQIGLTSLTENNENVDKKGSPPAVTNLNFQSIISESDATDLESMQSQLNPDAEEFVPNFEQMPVGNVDSVINDAMVFLDENGHNIGFGNASNSVPRHIVIEDDFVAQSPRKGRADNLDFMTLPAEQEFDKEADQRPHELEVVKNYNVDADNEHDLLIYVESTQSENDIKTPNSIDNGPETCVDTQSDVTSNQQIMSNELESDVMKQSMYVGSDNPIEDVLNSVQLIPSEVESENNSISEDIVHPSTMGDKELLQVEEKEDISKSPSTEEIQVNAENCAEVRDMILLEQKLEEVVNSSLKDSINFENPENPIGHEYYNKSTEESQIASNPKKEATKIFESAFTELESNLKADLNISPVISDSMYAVADSDSTLPNLQSCDSSIVNTVMENNTTALNIEEMENHSVDSVADTINNSSELILSEEKGACALSDDVSDMKLLVNQMSDSIPSSEGAAENLVRNITIQDHANDEKAYKTDINESEENIFAGSSASNTMVPYESNKDVHIMSADKMLLDTKITDRSSNADKMAAPDICALDIASEVPPEGRSSVEICQKENDKENLVTPNTHAQLPDHIAGISAVSSEEPSECEAANSAYSKEKSTQDNFQEKVSTKDLTEAKKVDSIETGKKSIKETENTSENKNCAMDLKSITPKQTVIKATTTASKSAKDTVVKEKKILKSSTGCKPINHSTTTTKSQINPPTNLTNRQSTVAASKSSTIKSATSMRSSVSTSAARKVLTSVNNSIKQKSTTQSAPVKATSSGITNATLASKPKVASPRTSPLVSTALKSTASGTIAPSATKPKAVSPRTTLTSQLRKAAAPAVPSVKNTAKPASSSISIKTTLSSVTSRPKSTAGIASNSTKPFTARPAPKFSSNATPTARRTAVASSNGGATTTSASKASIASTRKSSPIKAQFTRTTTKAVTTNVSSTSVKSNIKPLPKKVATDKTDPSKILINDNKDINTGVNGKPDGALAETDQIDNKPEHLIAPNIPTEQDNLRNSNSEHINTNMLGA